MTMDWLPQTPVEWIPLIVALVLGLILGWLFTRGPAHRRQDELQSELTGTQSKLKTSQDDLASAQRETKSAQADLSDAQSSLSDVREELEKTQQQLATMTEAKTAVDAELTARDNDLAQVRTDLSDAQSTASVEQGALQASLDIASDQTAAVQAQLDAAVLKNSQLTDDLAAFAETNVGLQSALNSQAAMFDEIKGVADDEAQDIENKVTALDEAYARAVQIQKTLDETRGELIVTKADLAETKEHLAVVTVMRDEMDTKLQRVRGDVAAELALLTSTMIQMKDEELVEANTHIADLQSKLSSRQDADSEAVG